MSPSAQPEYRRIRDALYSELEEGRLAPGERIPSERELVERFGVSHMTVRHAVDGLVREGLLVRRRGSGTFVVRTRAVARSVNRLQSFSEDVEGVVVGARVISQREVKPAEDVADHLELPSKGKVVELIRVRTLDGVPAAINHVWVPVRLAPGLAAAEMNDASLYDYLAQLGIKTDRARQKIFATVATSRQAELLELAEGSPLLANERLTRTAENIPVEFARSWTRPDLPVWVELRR